MPKLSMDNRFFQCMGNIGDLMILNVLFWITSLPIVTIGMSLTALYQVMLRRSRGESNYVAKEYMNAWKTEWKNSTKVWSACFATGMLLIFDFLYGNKFGVAFEIALGCVGVVWLFTFSYAFPMIARYENTIGNTLKNALILAITYFPATIIIVLINLIPVFCIACGTFTTMMAVPIYVVVGFALSARINCLLLNKIFQKFEAKQEEIRHEN